MDKVRKIALDVLYALRSSGAEKAECTVTYQDTDESNMLGHDEYLLREFESCDAEFTAYQNGRSATLRINHFDPQSLESYTKRAMDMLACSAPAKSTAMGFRGYMPRGVESPVERNPLMLYTRFEEMCADMKREFPNVDLDGSTRFAIRKTLYMNTEGAELTSKGSAADFGWQGAASDRRNNVSDIGFSQGTITDWEERFIDEDRKMRKNARKLTALLGAKPIGRGKFTGTLVLPPDFVGAYTQQIVSRVESMEDGDGLPSPECSGIISLYTVRSDKPFAQGEPALNSPTARAVYSIKDGAVIPPETKGMDEKDRLKCENKRLLEEKELPYRASVIEPGAKPFAELIKGVKQGLLVGFISGTEPNANGDFSGAAKGSFYIENGEIKHPVTECMVCGNVFDMFKHVEWVSSDAETDDYSISPYVAVSGATII